MKDLIIMIIMVIQLTILIITGEFIIPYALLALIIVIEFSSKLMKIYKK